MTVKQGEKLSMVNSVADLKKLRVDELPQLCDEIRQFIIHSTSFNPGHLGANLGTVEMSVALHYVFDTPNDKLIWDVGHQAYTHKILTGRKNVFHTNRTYHGISGYPRMSESEFDAFGVGHSSTSISAALGMAVASSLKGEFNRQHIAVIGDGSMTAGMAFEAMNHAGVSKANLLVILNDNGIAIDKNVGALKEYLTDITTSRFYNRLKGKMWHAIRANAIRRMINKFLLNLKSTIVKQSNLFEALNFRYFGPVDGHDIVRMVKILTDLKNIKGAKLLHCITVKGKGFTQAEKEQTRFHAPGLFDKNTGAIIEQPCHTKAPKMQVVFGRSLVELAELNPLIVGVTPAMLTGCSMNILQAKFPARTFDVGIAEQHAVTFSAGLASQGLIPFCNIYSSFLQRSYDQIIHDVAIQNLSVVFCIDRGGLVGEDGATHHGVFDLSYLRCIPNMIVTAPMNEEELRDLMFTAQSKKQGPFAIRYPRTNAINVEWKTPFKLLEIGKGRMLKDGDDLAIISIGFPGNLALKAIEELETMNYSVSLYDMRFLKPIDEELLHKLFSKHKKVITIEDGTIIGGLGSAVAEFANQNGYLAEVIRLG
ncbi:MAG: 1-deoxy-D-xylulose-5-phosphate synthase, partial [Bacteroidota bacterium]